MTNDCSPRWSSIRYWSTGRSSARPGASDPAGRARRCSICSTGCRLLRSTRMTARFSWTRTGGGSGDSAAAERAPAEISGFEDKLDEHQDGAARGQGESEPLLLVRRTRRHASTAAVLAGPCPGHRLGQRSGLGIAGDDVGEAVGGESVRRRRDRRLIHDMHHVEPGDGLGQPGADRRAGGSGPDRRPSVRRSRPGGCPVTFLQEALDAAPAWGRGALVPGHASSPRLRFSRRSRRSRLSRCSSAARRQAAFPRRRSRSSRQ